MMQFFRSASSAPPSAPTETAPGAPASPLPAATLAPAASVVLVVDDSAMIRVAVTKTLVAANYEVIQAVNGREGLATWEANRARVTVVLSDVFMPEMDGLTMARELRRRSRSLPIALMSSKLDEDSRWVAEEAGFRLMPKPFKDAYLLELIARMIRLRSTG